jgi:hypothetical protein
MEFAFTIPGSSEPATVDAVGFYVAGHTHKVKVSDARQSNARQSNARQSNAPAKQRLCCHTQLLLAHSPSFFTVYFLASSHIVLRSLALPPTLCFAHSLFLPRWSSSIRMEA